MRARALLSKEVKQRQRNNKSFDPREQRILILNMDGSLPPTNLPVPYLPEAQGVDQHALPEVYDVPVDYDAPGLMSQMGRMRGEHPTFASATLEELDVIARLGPMPPAPSSITGSASDAAVDPMLAESVPRAPLPPPTSLCSASDVLKSLRMGQPPPASINVPGAMDDLVRLLQQQKTEDMAKFNEECQRFKKIINQMPNGMQKTQLQLTFQKVIDISGENASIPPKDSGEVHDSGDDGKCDELSATDAARPLASLFIALLAIWLLVQ